MNDAGSLVVALITAPEANAAPIARALVERRLAACVNVLDNVRSVYRWEGEVEAASEALLIVKAHSSNIEAMTALLNEIHPYDNYELVTMPISGGNPAYLEWIAASS